MPLHDEPFPSARVSSSSDSEEIFFFGHAEIMDGEWALVDQAFELPSYAQGLAHMLQFQVLTLARVSTRWRRRFEKVDVLRSIQGVSSQFDFQEFRAKTVASFVPLYWRIRMLTSGFDANSFRECVASLLSTSWNALDEPLDAVAGLKKMAAATYSSNLSLRNMITRPLVWESRPHVPLLYIGGFDTDTAAEKNELSIEDFEDAHQQLCRCVGQEIEFTLDGVIGDQRFLVARAVLPTWLPNMGRMPSMTFINVVGKSPEYTRQISRDLSDQCIRLPHPVQLRGVIELFIGMPRDNVVNGRCTLQRQEDMFMRRRSPYGNVDTKLEGYHVRMWRIADFNVLQLVDANARLRDRFIATCAYRWPSYFTALRPMTMKGAGGSRTQSAEYVYVKFPPTFRLDNVRFRAWLQCLPAMPEFAKDGHATQHGTQAPRLYSCADGVLPDATKCFDALVAALKAELRELDAAVQSLFCILCALRSRNEPLYRLTSQWLKIMDFLVPPAMSKLAAS